MPLFERHCGSTLMSSIYNTFNEADSALQSHAFANGYSLRSQMHYPDTENPTRVTYQCSKGRRPGQRASNHGDTHSSKKRQTSSQRTNCRYRVNLKLRGSVWVCEAIASRGLGPSRHSSHNHPWIQPAAFAPWRIALLSTRKDEAIAAWNSGSQPSQIAATLRATGPPQMADIMPKDISNLLANYRREELGGLTPIRWLLKVYRPSLFEIL
jgi:hypothetical protein